MTGQPVTPIDRQPGALGRRRHRVRRGPGRRHRARPAAHLPVVHPRGRPRRPCCSPASPATASTWSRTARSPARSTTSAGTRARSTCSAGSPTRARRCRRSAASGATTTSRVRRCRPCGSPTSTCRASPRHCRTVATADLPTHASVVVIGGGVMGLSTAYHLARAGVTRRRPGREGRARLRLHLQGRRRGARAVLRRGEHRARPAQPGDVRDVPRDASARRSTCTRSATCSCWSSPSTSRPSRRTSPCRTSWASPAG